MLTSVGHSTIDHQALDSREESKIDQLLGKANQEADKIRLDLAEFSENISVLVDREIMINDWLFATVNTTVLIINNQTDVSFNYLNLTIPRYEYKNIQYLEIVGEDLNYNIIDNIESDYVVIDIFFPEISTDESYYFEIIYGEGDGVEINAESLTDEKEAYRYNGSFLPLLSIPITNYNDSLYVFSSNPNIEVVVDQDTIQPKTEDVGVEVFAQAHYYEIENIFELPKLNVSTIDDYNLSLWSSPSQVKFIPAFNPIFEENMTLWNYLEFTVNSPYIKYDKVDSVIKISQWDDIRITETITVNVTGPIGNTIGGQAWSADADTDTLKYDLRIYGPYNMVIDSAKDEYGNISVSVTQLNFGVNDFRANISRIVVNPRINIGANPYIYETPTYTFTLSYRLKCQDFMQDLGNGKYAFNAPLGLMFNWTVREMNIKYIFPQGASSINSASYDDDMTSSSEQGILFFSKPSLKLNMKNVTMLHNVAFRITYIMPIYWPILEPLVYSTLFMLIGLIYIAIKNLGFMVTITETREESEIPFTFIEEFVMSYQEKTALRERILQLQEQRTRKGAKKVDQSINILQQKLKEVDRDLVKSIGSLSKKGKRYREAVQTIEISEAERSDVLGLLTQLETKKKERRIRNEAYRRLSQDYQRRLKRANNNIDKTLIELRTLLTEKQ